MESNLIFDVNTLLIGINIAFSVIISFVGFSKTKKLQNLIENEASKRELLQREYDLRKESIKKSEEMSINMFNNLYYVIDLLKKRKTEEADIFMMKESNDYYWKNIIFIPNELQNIYGEIIDLCIDAAVKYPKEIKEYSSVLKLINEKYFTFINKFRDIYYYNNSNLNNLTNDQIAKYINNVEEKRKRLTTAST